MIDISSDGMANFGIDTATQADALERQGVSINAHIILVDQGYMEVDLVTWFTINVLRGPGAFSILANTFNDYPVAFRRKLLHELRPEYALLDR